MVNVFVDIHLLEARIERMNLKPDSAVALYKFTVEKEVWNRNNVTEDVFKANHDYYLKDLETLNSLYTRVVDSLGVLESRLISEDRKRRKEKTKK